VTSSENDFAWSDSCRRSLERSRRRREGARLARRRRIRQRGGGLSILSVAVLMAVGGAGAAVGQSAVTASTEAASGLLVEGSSGPEVAAVQRALGIPADGAFGERTEANVRVFQSRHGLLVDGIVGPQTRRALGLGASRAAAAPADTPPLGSAASTGPAPQSAGPAPQSGPAPGSLQQIAQCESGGNPGAVGGNGRYRGKYQFTHESWRAVGGSGDPAAAPEAEQDRRAAALYQRSGTASWPNCG
jgi:hypothetical protein